MTETDLMRRILIAICALPGALFTRRNVGVFRTLDGRKIAVGLPGQADITGIYRGRAVEIEVKTPLGRLSNHQKAWRMAVERAGGVFVLARTPADALNALAALEDAQSDGPPDSPTHGCKPVNGVALS
jgi:hypothetical protein